MKHKQYHSLNQLLLRLVLWRLFLPLLAMSILGICVVGYLGEQSIETHQRQTTQSIAQMVDYYLDQAGRALDAVVRVAEASNAEDLTIFMQSTWEAHRYFETLYYLDENTRVKLMVPSAPRYLGLDMSNLPDFKRTERDGIIFSRPFISLRTGEPTVYLLRRLSNVGIVVGELSLAALQHELTRDKGISPKESIFILDQFGKLLAHPSSDLVRQQTNLGQLEIFRRGLTGEATLVYNYSGAIVLASSARVKRVPWIVVDQIPLFVSLSPYAWIMGITLFTLLAAWITLVWNLRKQLNRNVVAPLTQLSRMTNALSMGDFSKVNPLTHIHPTFDEVNTLSNDFLSMSCALQARQAALEESEERFRRVFEQGPLGMSILRPNLERVAINAKLVEMLGFSKEELLQLTFLDFTHPDDLELTREHIDKLLRKEIPFYQIEKRYIKKGGEIIWVRVTLSAVRDSQGELLYLVSMIEEITGRKKAEEAVDRANKEWVRTFNAISDSIMVLDDQHGIVRANKAMCDALGMSQEELIGRLCFELVHGEEAPPAFCPHSQLLSNGKEHSAEVMEPLLEAVLDVRVSPILDRNGQIIGSVHVARNITERKKAETALQRSNELLRAIIEAAPTAIIGLDLEGNVQTVWNPAAEKMLGWSAREVMGCPLPTVPADKQDEFRRFRERIRSGITLEGVEVRRRRRDGTLIDYSIYASPLHDHEGRITGNIAVLVDITEKKSLQSQLLQAQKMESVGNLAGGIAHDFNNLLTVILGISQLLLIRCGQQDPVYTYIRKINQAAENGADLVKRILAFSRKAEMRPLPVNLSREVEQVRELLFRTIPKMIEVKLALSNDIALANADPIQIEQILFNLAGNAVDAMPDGGTLTIETNEVTLDEAYCKLHLGAKPGDYVMLTVSDTGHGMDPETLQHIFEPFYTTKEQGKGTGLGLAMVYGIVEQHGGHITCCSEPGMGTVFKICFPVISSGAESGASADEFLFAEGSETVLLVDDDETVREMGKEMLELLGYTVLTASDGREALRMYNTEKDTISLVILDLIMPEMGGKECFKNLLKIDPTVKVLIASGYTSGGSLKDAATLGARGFVDKPYDMKKLLKTVREVLDAK